MSINLQLPIKSELLKPTITVVGVGGAGGNAVNNMIAANLEGVNFVVANTDAQALEHALTDRAIQLGAGLTRGLGAGANPEIGRAAAEEASDEIASYIQGSNMVFITAGMGGGTGTGAAPVVARVAREQGVLTVAVVTKPFQFEGTHRMRLADTGLKELQEYVDTLIIIPNQNLFRIANERTTFSDAFKMADEVLHSGVRGVTDLMVKPGLINLDFADIRTVMREMGKAMMGTGEASGDRRAIEAAEAAISNPLLDDVSLKGARAALINITGGPDMTLFEVDEAANRIREEVDPEANIIFGSAFNDAMEGRMRVSVVATGIDVQANAQAPRTQSSPIEQKKPYLFMNTGGSRAEAPKQAARPQVEVPKAPIWNSPVKSIERAEAPKTEAPRESEPARDPLPAFLTQAAPKSQEAAAAPQPQPMEEATLSLAVQQSLSPAYEQSAMQPSLGSATVGSAALAVTPKPAMPAAPAPRDYRPARDAQDEEVSMGRSLFKRLADVGRSLTPKPETGERERPAASSGRSVQVSEKPKPDTVRKANNPYADQEQFLDIPAFLRRQAN